MLGKTLHSFRGACAVAGFAILFAGTSVPADAQNQIPNLLGGFGNLINQAQSAKQRQLAADAWAATDPTIVDCFQNMLRVDVQQLINNGIAPNDPRNAARMNQCQRAIADAHARQQQDAERQKQREIDQANAERDRKRKEVEAQAAYLKAKADAEKTQSEARARAEAEQKQRQDETLALRGDFALAGLLGADPRDITVLIAAHDTPRVIRNLAGDPVFQKGAVVCFPFGALSVDQSTAQGRFARNVFEKVAQKGGASVSTGQCSASSFGQFDLLVFASGQLDDANLDILRPVSGAIKDGAYVKFATYSQADFEAEMKDRKATVEADAQRRNQDRIAASEAFQKRDAQDISAIYVEKPASTACMLSASVDGLRYLLERGDSPFADLVTKETKVREQPTMDSVFLAVKKRECLAVIAPSGNLKEILGALARDNINIDFHPGTVAAARLSQWKEIGRADPSKSPNSWWSRLVGQ